ncbi:MAG: nuclear transport factor 2 family protein [Pseudolysinimonas sp.]|uniref:nuclear transport factor 2 family protein n=1 Tax=Pseudolysinimonas sp. TaxID=2680009 RepID=UPI003263F3FB
MSQTPAGVKRLPLTIKSLVDATNAGDHDAFVATFAPDAVLVDWGKVFEGRDGIADWDESDNIGRKAQLAVAAVRADGDDWVVTIDVTGGGFNGTSTFRFTLVDNLIARVEIAP